MQVNIRLGLYYCAIAASVLALLAGGWLILAPFALGYQPYTSGWTAATGNDVWCGALLVAVALARLLLIGYTLGAELRAAGVLPAGSRRAAGSAPIRRSDLLTVAVSLSGQIPLLVAVWLIVSPWVMQTQQSGATWNPGTVNNLTVGVIVLGAALVGIGATLTGFLYSS